MRAVKNTLVPVAGLLVLLAAVAGIVIYMHHAPAFEVTHIGIRGTVQLDPNDLAEHLNIQPHTNIFQIQLDEIQERLETLQWIKMVKVYRNVPNKLRIDVIEREPFALVKLDQLHIIDNEGVVLGALASGSAITLPIITGEFIETAVEAGGENSQLYQALHAIDGLMQASPPVLKDVRKILLHSLDNATFISYDPTYPDVRLSLLDQVDNVQRFYRTSHMLQSEKLTYANIASVDLRFVERAIVTRKK
jgi:cell division septal protein FtsQ